MCGFHVAFLTVHFPAYVTDLGLPAHVGAYALSIVGLVNIAGAFMAGIVGQRFQQEDEPLRHLLRPGRVVIAAMLVAPASELTIYLFSFAMGAVLALDGSADHGESSRRSSG